MNETNTKYFKLILLLPFLIYTVKGYCETDTTSFNFPNSRNINFRNINSKNGLSHNFVNTICQDKKGLIWLGTANGLNCFDGTTFSIYQHKIHDSTTLSSSRARKMIINSDSTKIYYTSQDGFNILNLTNNQINRFYNDENDSNSLRNNSCYSVAQDKKGRVWIGSFGGGLNFFDNNINAMQRFPLQFNSAPVSIPSLLCDGKNTLWVAGLDEGLALIHCGLETKVKYIYPDCKRNGLCSKRITSIYEDSNGQIFVLSENGIFLYLEESNTFRKIKPKTIYSYSPLDNCASWNMVQDKLHRYWVATDNGLIVISSDLRKCVRIMPDINNKNGLQSRFVQSLFVDKENNIWIGTQNGVSIYNDLLNQFGVIDYNPDEQKNINLSIYSHSRIVTANNTSVTIALEDRYVCFDKGSKQEIPLPKITEKYFPISIAATDKYGNSIIPALNHDGIYLRKAGKTKVHHLTTSNTVGLTDNYIFKAFSDSQGYFWLLTDHSGIMRYDVSKNEFLSYTYSKNDSNSILSNWVFNITEDYNGNIWVTSWSGLAKYNYTLNNFERHLENQFPIIYNLHEEKGLFWLSTSSGIVHYDPSTKQIIKVLTEEDGLKDNNVLAILPDENNNLWVSTSTGLNLINTNTYSIITFGTEDGLKDGAFLYNSFCKAEDGLYYFGGTNGLNYFNPDNIIVDSTFASPIITGVKIFNKPIQEYEDIGLKKEVSYVDRFKLSHKHYVLSLNFSSLNYTHSGIIKLRYKLKGFDQKWVEAGTNRSVTYINLPSGKYTFKVQASNQLGDWSRKYDSIKFEISPPFRKTIWFQLLLSLLAIFIVIVIIRINNKLLIRKKNELERLVHIRTKEIQDGQNKIKEQKEELSKTNKKLTLANVSKDKILAVIAHDLRNPFSSILGFSDLLIKNYENDPDERKLEYLNIIQDSSEKAYTLLETLLEWAKSEQAEKFFQPENINISKLIKEGIKYVQSAAKSKEVSIMQKNTKKLIAFADSNMIQTVLRNLLLNAIKYSYRKGIVEVNIKEENKLIVVSIIDKGVGLSQERTAKLFDIDSNDSQVGTENEKGTGFGLIICKDFVEQNNGRIWIESTLGEGSTFSFSIPAEKKSESN